MNRNIVCRIFVQQLTNHRALTERTLENKFQLLLSNINKQLHTYAQTNKQQNKTQKQTFAHTQTQT